MKQQSATPKIGAVRRSRYRHGKSASEVPAITNAAVAHSDEMHQRMVKYATAMGIRMVCLVSIFIFDGWFKLIPIIGAVILPWVAVVIANGGSDIVHRDTVELLDEAPMYAVAPGADPAAEEAAHEVLAGEIVPDDGAPAEYVSTEPVGTESVGTHEAGTAQAGTNDAGTDGAVPRDTATGATPNFAQEPKP